MNPDKKPNVEENEKDSQDSATSEKDNKDTNALLPEELVINILLNVDNKTLLSCRLVCKQWMSLLESYVWQKKAIRITGRELPLDENVPWTSYFYLCEDLPFGKNLIYDKVAPYNNKKSIQVIDFEKGEDIPVRIQPFPDDDTFQGKCIITGNHTHHNKYSVDLLEEGFTKNILDKIQPIVKVCEWYAVEKDAEHYDYNCTYKLIDEDSTIRAFSYNKHNFEKGKWIKFTHSFQNYGEGLRRIRFYHGVSPKTVIVGASVTLEVNMYHDISKRKLNPFVEWS